jgi:hypothetical protein
MSTSHFRNRLPSHPMAQKLRNNPKRGGAIADEAGDKGGSENAELTRDAESMFDFAQRERRDREARIDPVGVKRRAKGRKTR